MVRLKHYWWTYLIHGIFAVAFGLVAFFWPGLTLLSLVMLFGIWALVDGILLVSGSIASRHLLDDWWLLLLIGIGGILIGALAFARPGITALVLLFFIAMRALVTGALEIAMAIRLRKVIGGEWALMLAGILSVIFGLLVFGYPFEGAMAIVWLIAAYAIIYGLIEIGQSFSMRHWEKSEHMPFPTPA